MPFQRPLPPDGPLLRRLQEDFGPHEGGVGRPAAGVVAGQLEAVEELGKVTLRFGELNVGVGQRRDVGLVGTLPRMDVGDVARPREDGPVDSDPLQRSSALLDLLFSRLDLPLGQRSLRHELVDCQRQPLGEPAEVAVRLQRCLRGVDLDHNRAHAQHRAKPFLPGKDAPALPFYIVEPAPRPLDLLTKFAPSGRVECRRRARPRQRRCAGSAPGRSVAWTSSARKAPPPPTPASSTARSAR